VDDQRVARWNKEDGTGVVGTDNSDRSSQNGSALSEEEEAFLAEADFASAVARAAQLSGLTVVGSTVTNPNSGGAGREQRGEQPTYHTPV